MSPNDGPDNTRGLKRVRVACSNCRRKKVRCSGDRPTCAFCEKLSQPCQYIYYNGPDHNGNESTNANAISNVNGSDPKESGDNASKNEKSLLLRMELLESTLTRLAAASTQDAVPNNSAFSPTYHNPRFSISETQPNSDTPSIASRSHSGSANPVNGTISNPWEQFPPRNVILSTCNLFFLHCHNQPYSFFHEATFHAQIEAGEVSDHLLYAFLASAVRFSADPFFAGKQMEAMDSYAKLSWDVISSRGFVIEEDPDISVVQAISLLAIIDSAAGRRRAAWIKIGLAVRISQDLGLMVEPDAILPVIDQEVRRRLFWSVYMLDRFVSCSKQKPSLILDDDCRVQLPCDEDSFRDGFPQTTSSLTQMSSGRDDFFGRPSDFCLAIVMASALGRSARYSLDLQPSDTPIPPWDPKSEYALISSTLTTFESISELGCLGISNTIQHHYIVDGKVDQQKAGHFILYQALFHLSYCLLNHPFLLRKHIENIRTKVPASWLSHASESCLYHARALSSLFRDAQLSGCIVSTSFYGYCALVSGGIHALNVNSNDEVIREESMKFLTLDVHLLEELSSYWKNSALISRGLQYFWKNSSSYKELISTKPSIQLLDTAQQMVLWSIVDYGVMSNPQNLVSNSSIVGDPGPQFPLPPSFGNSRSFQSIEYSDPIQHQHSMTTATFENDPNGGHIVDPFSITAQSLMSIFSSNEEHTPYHFGSTTTSLY